MKPNVIMLLLDATRADHLFCYGYDRKTTPFLQDLAAESVVYDRAYASSIWTLPSCSSIFTGKYPSEHQVVDWGRKIRDPTFMNNLRSTGYSTHTISAHIGASDGFGIADSFDTRVKIENRSNGLLFEDDPVFEEMEERRKADTYGSAVRRYLAAVRLALEKRSFKSIPNVLYHQYQMFRRRHGLWMDNGAEEILSRSRDLVSETESPYFLFLDFLEAHQPYRPPRGYIDEFLPADVAIEELNDAVDANHVGRTITGEGFDEREQKILQGLYDGTIKYLDNQIESFYRFLEESGEARDTVFIVLADHGDLFGEWNLWGHQGQIHNRLCHVPLLIRYPWGNGRREDSITELRQLFDHLTVLGEGVDPKRGLYMEPQGEAITEYYGLDTQVSITPWEEYDVATKSEWGSYQVSLVRDNWRLFEDVSTGPALYNIETDPDEECNVVADHEDVRTEMRDRIRRLVGDPEENHQRYRASEGTDSFGLDEETTEHLEELGYM